MGGKSRQIYGRERKSSSSSSSSFFSMFNILFKPSSSRGGRKSGEGEDTWDEAINVRRVRPSDEDKGRWVAEPDIDRKASDFIAKFYETRVSDSDRQIISVPQSS